MMLVQGRTYRTGPPRTLKNGTLRAVQRDFGLNWQQVMEWFDSQDLEEMTMATLWGVPEFQAWMYAWLLNGGGVSSLSDFDDLEWADTEFTRDAGEEEEVDESDEPPDPTQASDRTGSSPGGASPVKRNAPKKSTSKTSKRR